MTLEQERTARSDRESERKSELDPYGRGPEAKDRACVGGVPIRAADHGRDESALVLLGRRVANREFYPDVWDVPGGHLELAHPSCTENLRGAAPLASGARRMGCTASKIVSSGRQE